MFKKRNEEADAQADLAQTEQALKAHDAARPALVVAHANAMARAQAIRLAKQDSLRVAGEQQAAEQRKELQRQARIETAKPIERMIATYEKEIHTLRDAGNELGAAHAAARINELRQQREKLLAV